MPRTEDRWTGDGDTVRVRWWERRKVVVVVIALVLVGLSFLNDPEGYLGTDTGGKTATLEAMDRRGDWSVDVGYWAEEHDPTGRFHPLYGTSRTDEGWVQVTSVPMILAARPLWALGGYRAALLLPIAGTVAAALAGSALAERLGTRRDGTTALWVVGLGSPLLVYGLDLWEHSLGVAAILWATVLLHRAATGATSPLIGSVGAGALLAAAATMRTEALVYALVLVGGAGLWSLLRTGLRRAVLLGGSAVAGFAPVWLANAALEQAIGGQSRTGRATGAASAAGSELGVRVEEGLRTTFSLAATSTWGTVVIGVALTLAVATAVAVGDRCPRHRLGLVVVGLASFTLLTAAPGLGFVPGLFAAFPVAAAALALGRLPPDARPLVAAALAALPVVWAFQFIGGAGPQWGGRYVLASTAVLGVVGIVALGARQVPGAMRVTVLGMCVAVNVFGTAWLWQRTHEIDDLFDRIVAVQDQALIARNPFFLREAGPVALDHRWLSAVSPDELDGPAHVLADAGVDRYSVLQVEGEPAPDLDGMEVTGVDRVGALGVVFEVVHLARR